LILLVVPVSAEVEIVLTGLSKELQASVTVAIVPPPALTRPGPVNAMWLDRYLRKLPAEIRSVLEPYGYFHTEINIYQDPGPERVLLRVQVDPGPPVLLVERRVEILKESGAQPVLSLTELPLKVGAVLREDDYETEKAELLARVREQGYLDARYTRHELQIDRELNEGRVIFEISPGPRSRFGDVSFNSTEGFPERFLRRYLAFEKGKPFSYRLLGKTQKNFRDSDYFRRVVVAPQAEKREPGIVPIDVDLEARPRFSLRPGVGYGTDTGARAALRYLDNNAWGLGHKFNLDMLVAQRVQNYTGGYAFPGYRNLDTGLNLNGGYRGEQFDTYDNRYIFSEVEQTYGFGRGRVGAVFVRAQYEKSDISGDLVSTGFLMPGVRYTEIQLPESTGKGYGFRIQGEARISDSNFLSDISLAQLLGNGDLLFPLPWRLSVVTRLQVATSILQNTFDDIPASLRFFAGGDRSVRGYAYQSLGPKDESGNVIGGKNLLTGSVELVKTFGQHWGLALFVDAGNAFDAWSDYTLAVGAGFGVRYATPVGPIQVDLASPVSTGSPSVRLHIGIGFGW